MVESQSTAEVEFQELTPEEVHKGWLKRTLDRLERVGDKFEKVVDVSPFMLAGFEGGIATSKFTVAAQDGMKHLPVIRQALEEVVTGGLTPKNIEALANATNTPEWLAILSGTTAAFCLTVGVVNLSNKNAKRDIQ